jgi:hypothetical protein
MNNELKRLELAIMNVFMYLLVLIIGKSKVFFALRQCRINHMAEAAYATGPALLGAPRFSLLFFF